MKTSPVEQRLIQACVNATGVVTYNERLRASLSARVSGNVWRVVKHPGDPVSRGDVLVIIDAAEVGRAKAEFLSDLVTVESKLEILSSLEKVGEAVSQRQVREARVALREARIRLQNSEQTLTNLGLSLRREDFEPLNDVQRATKLHFLGLPESITKDLDPDDTTSNLLPVTASFDGILLQHDVALGESVKAGTPVLEIADLRRMWLKLNVPMEFASKLELGQHIRFLPDGLQSELESEITWISSEMNEKTRTLAVQAEVNNPIVSADPSTGNEVRLLRANTFGTGTIRLGESISALVIPVSTVLSTCNQQMVFVKVGALSFAPLNVKLGMYDGNFVQIEAESLKPGMEVVSHNNHVLKSQCHLNDAVSTRR